MPRRARSPTRWASGCAWPPSRPSRPRSSSSAACPRGPPTIRATAGRGCGMTSSYDAVLFDLDGVLTSTAALHASCWKSVFDQALADWTARTGQPQEPFGEADYLAHVDGKPRHDGVRDFLAARGVD